MKAAASDSEYDVVVVGGGAAGIGVAVALKDAGIRNFVVLERDRVGASFDAWPAETQFITPSFPSNSIGMLDLNSIAIGASPAFSLRVEHPTGKQYASHLRGVAQYFELPISPQTEVERVDTDGDGFRIDTADGPVRAKHVVWAAGEFQYPHRNGFSGSDLCRHTATIPSYAGLEGDEFLIIGGYESGVDAAYHLARRGKTVRLLDSGCPWETETSDPSIALSTYSFERMRSAEFAERVELYPNARVESVTQDGHVFDVATTDGEVLQTPVPPLYAGGFEGSHKFIQHLFEQRGDGLPLLSERDESTIVPGVFLCGPTVRHDNHVFCFIYKYRQRFAVVAKAVATSLGLPATELEEYRNWGMYLDDLSVCGEECEC